MVEVGDGKVAGRDRDIFLSFLVLSFVVDSSR